MKCPECQFENREEAIFCRKCGASLEKEPICQNCNSTNPPDSGFCEKCGHNLTLIVEPTSKDLSFDEKLPSVISKYDATLRTH